VDHDLPFDLKSEQPRPNAFIQWKGTDVCMDFWCECGEHSHIDAMFAYAVKCWSCGTVWEMPSHVYPRKAAPDFTGPFVIDDEGSN